MTSPVALTVVLPVFNEEKNIAHLIHRWQHYFIKKDISFEFIIINDGSTDSSLAVLEQLAKSNSTIKVYSQENKGHGPAIRKGYTLALQNDWVFQLDADSLYDTDAFEKMWNQKADYDFLVGQINQKNTTTARWLISWVSVTLVKLLCGASSNDINTPYRLMRTEDLASILPKIAEDSFAVNIMLSMYYIRNKKRKYTTPLNYADADMERKSKMNGYFLRGALLSFFQLIQFGRRL